MTTGDSWSGSRLYMTLEALIIEGRGCSGLKRRNNLVPTLVRSRAGPSCASDDMTIMDMVLQELESVATSLVIYLMGFLGYLLPLCAT